MAEDTHKCRHRYISVCAYTKYRKNYFTSLNSYLIFIVHCLTEAHLFITCEIFEIFSMKLTMWNSLICAGKGVRVMCLFFGVALIGCAAKTPHTCYYTTYSTYLHLFLLPTKRIAIIESKMPHHTCTYG